MRLLPHIKRLSDEGGRGWLVDIHCPCGHSGSARAGFPKIRTRPNRTRHHRLTRRHRTGLYGPSTTGSASSDAFTFKS